MHTALTIAGSDPSGGAGIQADIKTLSAHGIYAVSAITALTAQNTTGVYHIFEIPPEFLAKQLDCIFTDIFPDAVKIGMIPSAAHVEVIAEKLNAYHAKHIVVDPLIVSTSGARLADQAAVDAFFQLLFPIAELITPNIPEAKALSECTIQNTKDMAFAALTLNKKFGCNVLVKGGHLFDTADDILCQDGKIFSFPGKRIDNPNTHGTGCTLSSAIAGNLASGLEFSHAIQSAKEYLSGAIAAKLVLGHGTGPLNHLYRLQQEK